MWVLTPSQNQKREDRSWMWNPVPPLLPLNANLVNQTSQKNLISARSSSDWPCRQHRTHNPTPLDGSAKEVIYASANSVDCRTASSPSKMRYCVMLLLLNFVMFFWANLIYGNVMLYMSLGLVVLLLLWTRNYIGYPRQSHLHPFPSSIPSNASSSSLILGCFYSS